MVRNPPHGRASRARLSAAAALTTSLLIASISSPPASVASDDHSDLHHRKSQLVRSIDARRTDVDEISRELLRTRSRLVDARASLTAARADLTAVRGQVRAAAAADQRMQALLRVAVHRLRDARGDLVHGQREVRSKRGELAAYAVSSYQSVGSLSLGIAFESESAQEALNNLQAADTVLAKQSSTLQRFQATGVLLKLTAKRVHESTVAVARRRALAASTLDAKRALEVQARTAKGAVAARVTTLRAVRSDMAAAKRTEIHRLGVLKRERDRVDERLQVIAERRARRHAREERRARRQAIAERRQARGERRQAIAERRQAIAEHRQRHQERVLAHAQAAKPTPAPVPDTRYLDYPVADTYITSPYGMRMHPVLHILELHDGTDFHAPCGSPVYAAADGTVLEEYYNAGYGNRLLIDNGYVEGVSLSTSYNHLSSYVAGVGEHVTRGALIAYSGNTGWSTACHLHFMVYVNGRTVDPVTWL